MKKAVTLTLIFLLASFQLYSQSNFHERGYSKGSYAWIQFVNKNSSTYKKQKLKEIYTNKTLFNKDSSIKRVTVESIKKLDTEGRIIEIQNFSRKGKITYSLKVDYNDKGQISRIERIDGKRGNTYQYHYHNDSLLSSILIKNRKDQSGIYYTYNDDLRLTEEKYVKNGKPYNRLEYDYFNDGSKKYTRIFNKKDKLVYTYNYTCGINKTLSNHKDTSTVCNRTQTLPNGNQQTSKEEIDEKGRIFRTVSTFNTETNWYLTEVYSSKNKLRFRHEASQKDEVHFDSYKVFNRRGKLRFSTDRKFWKDPYGHYTFDQVDMDGERVKYSNTYILYP